MYYIAYIGFTKFGNDKIICLTWNVWCGVVTPLKHFECKLFNSLFLCFKETLWLKWDFCVCVNSCLKLP